MNTQPRLQRPPFAEALRAWENQLAQKSFPTSCLWIFDENLCFEKDTSRPSGYRLGFQTTFTPPPPGAERIAFEYFSDFNARLVFYRVGSNGDKSVCLLLCDRWFEPKRESDGFIRRDEWLLSFRPGPADLVEEIKDRARWENRLLRNRPLHDLDFCMTLRAVHETLAHGRVLSTYERSALRVLHIWRRMFGEHR